ncbi:MAG: GerAB/ArcD/ProY family transporter, partial [Acutalibacteraceae bacterium]|nr:GerAB/ArcD/ProY family transporter [Acutalibacteraceae bacterium]
MTAEPTYNKHLASLTAIFVLGDAVIVLPSSNSGDYPLLGFFIGAAAAVLLYFSALSLTGFIGKKYTSVLGLLAAAYAFYSAGISFIRCIDFANKILLPETSRFLIAALFIVCAVYLATRKQEVILKLSLIVLFSAIIAIITFFLLSAKDFNIKNILVYDFPTLSGVINSAKPYLINIALPAVLIPVYSALFIGKKRICATFSGIVTGLALILVCLLESLLLFGTAFAEKLQFPLAAAVSTVTVGQLFTRMDGIVYCLFFVTALIKSAVCI